MTRRLLVIAAGALALVLGAFLFVAWFVTFDDGGIRRGDLAYYVFVPRAVRRLPAPEACDEPVFASRTNDSLEAEGVSMAYRSRSTREDLHAALAEELEAMRCEGVDPPAGDDVLAFRCAMPAADLTLRAGEADATGCRPVTIEFRYR